MTTQHTPGPWELGRVSAPNTGATPIRWNGESLAWACGTDSAHGFDEATARANARLIATAPELLDTLKLLFEDWVTLVGDDCEDNEDVRRIWQACQDALTKVTNEPVMAA